MNRTATILIVTAVVAGVAGWAAAKTKWYYRERNAARAEAQATEERLTAPARRISALLAGADEVVLTYRGLGKDKREIRLRDPEWIRRFAAITGRARYELTGGGLWISEPEITFYRKQEQVLTFMMLSRVLRAHSPKGGGEFIVGEDICQALYGLVREAEAGQPAAKTVAARL